LKASVGQKSSNGKIVSGGAVKERKGWESSEKGQGRKTPASTQGVRVNLVKAVAVYCFPGCDTESWELNLHAHPRSQHHVRNETDMEEAERSLKH
jgi:hypothetical protein